MIDINEIMKILPHRYPFLLIDRIVELEPGTSARGIKNVTANEPFFQGHFPAKPVMLAFRSADVEGKLVYFMGIDNARFRRPVLPGDTLEISLEVIKARGKIWKFKAKASVDGEAAAEAELMATIMDQ